MLIEGCDFCGADILKGHYCEDCKAKYLRNSRSAYKEVGLSSFQQVTYTGIRGKREPKW